MRMKSKLLMDLLALAGALLFTAVVIPDEKRVIRPIKDVKDIRLSPSVYPEVLDLPPTERSLIETSYIQGFWDALTLIQHQSPRAKDLFVAYDGMAVDQIVETMHKFYKDNPQWRDMKPALILAMVIPRIRKGLSPILPKSE